MNFITVFFFFASVGSLAGSFVFLFLFKEVIAAGVMVAQAFCLLQLANAMPTQD